MKKKMSLKVKILSIILLSGLFTLAVNSLLAYKNNEGSLEDAAKDKFILTMSSKAEELERKLRDTGSSIRFFANNIATIEAMQEFSFAYNLSANQLRTKFKYDDAMNGLKSYYENKYLTKFKDMNAGKIEHDYATLTSNFSETTRLMQYAYIADNEFPLGEKNKLNKTKYETAYDKVHERYHSTFSKYLEEYKFYDAFLIDLQGNVIYTVYKELDFATNVNIGVVSTTGLAEVYKKVLALKDETSFALTDLAPYPLSYNVAAGFVGYPIKDATNTIIGVAVLQVDTSVLNSIVSFDKKWKEVGLGFTGESYIVGKDLYLRTPSRGVADTEKNTSHYSELSKLGFDKNKIDEIKAKGTDALIFEDKAEYMKQVVETKKATFNEYSENGKEFFVAFAPISFNGLEWFIIAKQEKSEILRALESLKKIIFIQFACFAVVLFILGYYYSSALSNELSKVVINLSEGSTRLSKSSTNIAQNATELSEATTEQAASLQETVSSVDEISAMVSKSSDAAQNSKQVSDQSRGAAQKGKETVSEMITAIEQINESNLEITSEMEKNSKEMKEIVRVITEIGNKTKVINDIVFQTKLLSFNASVEAARAGEHGKGFAVVAEEVGNLAQMSGKAADEISNMLAESVKKVETIAKETGLKVDKLIVKGKEKIDQGSRIAHQCDQALNVIIENVDRVNEMVTEISIAAKEQSLGIHEITKAMSQLDQVTQQNASVAQFASKSSEELSQEAFSVNDVAVKLNYIVNGKIDTDLKNIKSKVVKNKESLTVTTSNLVSLPVKGSKKMEISNAAKKVVGGADEIYGSVPSNNDSRFEEV